MWQIPHVLAKVTLGVMRKATALAALSAMAFAAHAQDSTAKVQDSTAAQSAAVPTVAEPAQNAENILSLFETPKDSVAAPVVAPAADTVATSEPSADSAQALPTKPDQSAQELKTVLYLSGGERSPWFHLGVLYAIEEYGIPIDSVVGTSWGAWVGSLWAKGVPLDEIQRLMKESEIAPYVGHDLSDPANTLGVEKRDEFELPISPKGIPSMRQRFTMNIDDDGLASRRKKSLYPDSMGVKRSLAKVRFQEILYRQNLAYKIPFSVQGCNGKDEGKQPANIIASMPLWNESGATNNGDIINGELCPHYALPVEDNVAQFPIIVIADPLRSTFSGEVRSNLLKSQAGLALNNLPGATVRAHTVLDTSYTKIIQLGFSTMEHGLKDFAPLGNRRISYKEVLTNKDVRKNWFRFSPSFDSLSSETHRAVKIYWNESDTGFVALEKFAEKLLKNPTYDSLDFDMQPTGDLMVSASVHPTFDVAVGGFGSNVFGANAYFEGSVNYVNQMEIELVLAGFWGMSSYGVQPRLNVSKLWNKHWGLQFGYDYLMLSPLKKFNSEISLDSRVFTEERSNLNMSVVYVLDANQTVSAEFLFGHSEFELSPLYYGNTKIKTNPVAPTLHYEFSKGDQGAWFSESGFVANVYAGLESIGFDYGIGDLIPIYWKLYGDVRYSISPKPFVSLTAGAAGGIERYRDEGRGYVSPKSFEYRPLDIAYRFQVRPTPWSTEWYNEDLASHEYTLVRGSASLHGKYFGAWLFAAWYHDFEKNPISMMDRDKFIVEPALRFAYKSFELYAGMNRIVDKESAGELNSFSDYTYFIRLGNYSF